MAVFEESDARPDSPLAYGGGMEALQKASMAVRERSPSAVAEELQIAKGLFDLVELAFDELAGRLQPYRRNEDQLKGETLTEADEYRPIYATEIGDNFRSFENRLKDFRRRITTVNREIEL